jgi:hypothetical protein
MIFQAYNTVNRERISILCPHFFHDLFPIMARIEYISISYSPGIRTGGHMSGLPSLKQWV